MDPNEALRRIRDLAGQIVSPPDDEGDDALSNDEEHDLAVELAETALGLDEWLTKGGFKPDAWK